MKKVLMMLLCIGQVAMTTAMHEGKVFHEPPVGQQEGLRRDPVKPKWWSLEGIGKRLNDFVAGRGKGSTSGARVPKSPVVASPPVNVVEPVSVAGGSDVASLQSASVAEVAAIRAEGRPTVGFADRFRSLFSRTPKVTFEELNKRISKITGDITNLNFSRQDKINEINATNADIDRQFENFPKDDFIIKQIKKAKDKATALLAKQVASLDREIQRLIKVRMDLNKSRAKKFPVEVKAENDQAQALEKADQAKVIQAMRDGKEDFMKKLYPDATVDQETGLTKAQKIAKKEDARRAAEKEALDARAIENELRDDQRVQQQEAGTRVRNMSPITRETAKQWNLQRGIY